MLALAPLLLVLAFARISAPGPAGTRDLAAPVRVVVDPGSYPTSARRLLSPALFALPGAFGFSAAPLDRAAPFLDLIPEQPSLEALPPQIPVPALPEVGATRVFSRAADYNLRLDALPVFSLDRPRPSAPVATATQGGGFALHFNQGLPADLFPDASLSGLGEKFPPSSQAWRMEAAVSVTPPGIVTSVLCAAADESAPGIAEAVSRAIRAWRPAPVTTPVRGVVSIHYTPPKTPTPTRPSAP